MNTNSDEFDSLANIAQYATYEDYLDEQVTERDMFYLQDEELARELVELGYRGSGDTLTRKEFEDKKHEYAERNKPSKRVQQILYSADLDLSKNTFLNELAKREEVVRNGKLTTILFIRCTNNRGQEISGYIDYGHRLSIDANFRLYFEGKKKLKPKSADLSFYNWETQTVCSNATNNFQVMADNENGLLFKHKRDRKVMNVDPSAKNVGDNSSRTDIQSKEYAQIVIFDHWTRRRMT